MGVIKIFTITICAFCLLSCDVSSLDQNKRLYPEAFDFEIVTIQQMLNKKEPGSVNINVYVSVIIECPEKSNCILPDMIGVSENQPPVDTLYIEPVKPSQFEQQKRYAISLDVSGIEERKGHDIRILGYSLIE
jgi:hypothetical protein